MPAKMIPAKPRFFSPGSQEDIMFSALEQLPEDYYVFHSFSLLTTGDSTIHESETDFVIFNRTKGLLCLEAKAGHVKYSMGEWRYGSGIKMSHDGPYNQASQNKWNLKDYIKNSTCSNLLGKCKLLHAVWFPSVSKVELKKEVLPPEALIDLTLTKEDLNDPLPSIERIFSMDVPAHIDTTLSQDESERLLRCVLCPSFDIVPAISMEHDLKKQVFHKMLSEQKCVLNYLIEQKSAVIQGVAGTGKTLIALEKARRHADAGEKVLFLCYNKLLHEYVAKNNENAFIDYYTIDGFACKLCNSAVPDYGQLRNVLEEFYCEGNFPYVHVIIDEGQDFGQTNIEENDIISLLESIIIDRENPDGSFYVFYDAMQLVQGTQVPSYISSADCKLTLYKNCRNTENIATTSMRPIRTKKPKLIDGCIKGTVPKMYFCDDEDQQRRQVEAVISKLEEKGIHDIVILTCATEGTSVLSSMIYEGRFRRKYRFTTCRKFKGLEADAVIVVDINKTILTTDAAKIFYVGASRARLELSLVCSLSKNECIETLCSYGKTVKPQKAEKALATEINALYAHSLA